MRASLFGSLLLVSLVACGDDTSGTGGGATSASASTGAGGSQGGGGTTTSSASGTSAGGAGGTSAGGAGGEGGAGGSAPAICDFAQPFAPPSSVLWPAELSATGANTLGGHGHDDGHGPVGFCAGTPVAGQPFYRLVAAGLETDTDIGGDGQSGDDFLRVDFWRDPSTFTGFGESGGRVNVYVEIVDEDGQVLDVDDLPELRIERTILGGPTDLLPLTSKPANEFQTNFAMVGGGARYGVALEGASDRVINLRLPVNHHVCYVLVFRREMP